ncbi:winged helix-turn-helix transcriptional regulator [Pectinatus cerevisiiphilus]|uniref:HxlR family transcriptional regulator n=1 Tax=Pectinatus cerevisiiphilus TaxID=86956 RepID=A0A4R3K2E1_9FIRM|nr:helix-turn-helix domain-containing protein [Pectinatus cerevisiiphilus]TCS76441.1 HxlR family transcriptional regulator [Pectinatus cerevisiiphilus]
MISKDELPSCPVTTTVQLIGNKWRLLILRLLFDSTCRFSVLLKNIPGISAKVLTDNLRSMENDGLITREVCSHSPLHVEYSISPLGNDLRPIITAIRNFGIKYCTLKQKTRLGLSLSDKKF